MDWLAILEKYGIATVVAGAMFFMVKRQNAYIQDELSKEMRSSFDTLTGILIIAFDINPANIIYLFLTKLRWFQ